MKDINTKPSVREIMSAAALLGSTSQGRDALQDLLGLIDYPTGSLNKLYAVSEVDALFTLLRGATVFDLSTPKWIKQAIETEGKIIKVT